MTRRITAACIGALLALLLACGAPINHSGMTPQQACQADPTCHGAP